MPRKRKAWWMMLRGPRGHRGPPGPVADAATAIFDIRRKHDNLEMRVAELGRNLDAGVRGPPYPYLDQMIQMEKRIAELERKLGGSQK